MADAGALNTRRRINPGSSCVVSRRCTQRRDYITPSPALANEFRYGLASAAQAFDIEIHRSVRDAVYTRRAHPT